MSCQNFLSSLCNLIFSRLNLSTASFGNQESHSSGSSGVSELPNTVILEILLKLPINSIIRCKFVCKSWHNLISDPYFAKVYPTTSRPFTAIALSEHRTITYPLDYESFCFFEIGTNSDVIRTPFSPKALEIPGNGILGIMGSCNGLLCLVKSPQHKNEGDGYYMRNRDGSYNNQTVCIINPLLGDRLLLPDVTSAEHIRDVVYGFGSSKSTNEHKVIRVVIKYTPSYLGNQIQVSGEIFTVGVDDGWRSFEDSCIPCYIFPCAITLNGVLHWIGANGRSGVIYAFDVGEETGRIIPLPPGLGDKPANIILAIWNDHLCLTDNSSEIQVDVWVMKEYGGVALWTRDFMLKRLIPFDLRPYPLIPITTLRNGELLMSRPYGQSLISFDPKARKCSKLNVFDVEGTVSFLFGYIPSFSSVKDTLIN